MAYLITKTDKSDSAKNDRNYITYARILNLNFSEYRQHCRAMCSKMAQQFRRCFCCCFKRTSSAVNTYNGLNGGIAAVPNTALKISRIPISAESQKANSNGRMIQISKAKETTVTSQCWAITRK